MDNESNFIAQLPLRIINGKIYDPKTAALIEQHRSNNQYSYLFCKENGELFIVLFGMFGSRPDAVRFCTTGKDLMTGKDMESPQQRMLEEDFIHYLKFFDADSIPERALKLHGFVE